MITVCVGFEGFTIEKDAFAVDIAAFDAPSVTVYTKVVATAGSVITVVDTIVFVTVSASVAVTVEPPSTGTTE